MFIIYLSAIKILPLWQKVKSCVVIWLMIAGAYALLAKIILDFITNGGVVSIIWPSSGVAVAGLLIGGQRLWTAIYVGEVLGNFLSGSSLSLSLWLGIGSSIEALIAVKLLKGYQNFDSYFNRFNDYIALLLVAMISACSSTILGTIGLWQFNIISPEKMIENLWYWWQGDLLGILMVTPFILVWRQLPIFWCTECWFIEPIIILGVGVLSGQILFIGYLFHFVAATAHSYWLFLYIVWSAIRLGQHGVLLLLHILLIQAIWGTKHHQGIFSRSDLQMGLENIWFCFLILSLVGIVLAIILQQRKFIEKQLIQRSEALSHSLALAHETESRFREMANSAPVLIWVAGLDKKCCWFNKPWLDFTGRSLDQELGDGWAENVHPQDFEKCVDYYAQHFELRLPFRMEYRLKRYDGEYRWVLDSGMPRFADQGEFLGFIGSCIDITEHKQLETQLLRSNNDLLRLSEISAHHLAEPVRRLQSYTQHLQLNLQHFGDINHEIESTIDYLKRDAKRMQRLIKDIQLYLNANQPKGRIKFWQTETIIKELISTQFMPKLQTRQAIVTIETLPEIKLDRPRLVELFSILIDNAIRHAQPPHSQSLQIRISGEQSEQFCVFRISDNGTGLDKIYHDRAFEIFERLSHQHPETTGAGLAIARRIVESLGGRIYFENHPIGTTVSFDLPDKHYAVK
ncbi:MAG: hypothetical protein RL637_1764 [Pseudomonadota bacterium]|jgi:PAS domain S-box-containing protein